ncbi:spore protease YyaC [Clostridium fallax]|uniref:Putative sporulation protein YyaC n=1 Tax=Clostridium fallax TaxID=1533 RepID=A0A1M4X2A0_9CLOT|nr:spore protease YyaC [Clostridium fallax]SHE87614.1 putative sporulation protein YyaC [Clostridium fallax]SQB22539.1 sporulation protein YyaC [Clostridium fallax]
MCNSLLLDSLDLNSSFILRDYLYRELLPIIKQKRTIIFLCIGSDRSTGDSLGPLVGDKLKFSIKKSIYFYGSLENPIHAKNLKETIISINKKFKNPYIVAIDACLGTVQNVGKILIEKKPLKPGLAVSKDLPPVGDLSILGIVNICGSLEFMVLQNTRLYTVVTLANSISIAINHFILKVFGNNKTKFINKIEDVIN